MYMCMYIIIMCDLVNTNTHTNGQENPSNPFTIVKSHLSRSSTFHVLSFLHSFYVPEVVAGITLIASKTIIRSSDVVSDDCIHDYFDVRFFDVACMK